MAIVIATVCAVAPVAQAGDYIFIGSDQGGTTIARANIDGTGLNEDFVTGQVCTCYLAAEGGYLYWSDEPGSSSSTIRRVAFDGTGITSLYTATTPAKFLSVGSGRFVYKSSGNTGTPALSSVKTDGTDPVANIFSGGSWINYSAIAGGKVYWAYRAVLGGSFSIARANLDGTNPELNFITMDNTDAVGPLVSNGTKLFWGRAVPAGNAYFGSANLDGTGVVHRMAEFTGQIGSITADGDHVYAIMSATSPASSRVVRTKLDGSDARDPFITLTRPAFGIAVQPGPSAPAPAPTPPPVQPTAKVTVPKALTLRPDGSVTATCGSEEKVALSSCTVTLRANASLADGPGGGVTVRAAKRVVIGRATATATGGETSLQVKVKLNQRGRMMLRANISLPVTVAMSITSAEKVTAEATARTRLSTGSHTVSPDAGIFDELSTALNAKGRAFVKRLVAILPKDPVSITCTGYADSSGVPGDNRWLGDRRARTLCDALAARGIEAKRTTIVSKGATSPRDDNSTAAGRERNRRATVTITY